MKKIIISAIATLAMVTAASATDLVKKKIPVPPTAPVATSSTTDSVSFGIGESFEPGFDGHKDYGYSLGYTHNFDSYFSAGVVGSYTQTPDNEKYSVEAQAGYKFPLTSQLTVSSKVGVGNRWNPGTQFPYYALYGAADYKLNDTWTVNALSYRYRNAFDVANNFESHQVGTGVTYNVNKQFAVNARVYRDFDSHFDATGDGVTLGVVFKF